MSYVVYNSETTEFLHDRKNPHRRNYATERAAKSARTRICKREDFNAEDWDIAEADRFHANIELKRRVKNMMSGKWVTEPVNTPYYMSVSSESYWSA